MSIESDKCPHCGEIFGEAGDWGRNEEHYCIDCWPGYDLCKACEDYRCEHAIPDAEDLKDEEFTSLSLRQPRVPNGVCRRRDQSRHQ
jgi:hypothetical protein